jgi:tetratricopeptide (TPR) repeat protein
VDLSIIWKFITDNWKVLIGSGGFIGSGGLWLLFQNYRKDRRKRLIPRSNNFPFEVISPSSNDVVKQLFGNNSSDDLADFKIPYQSRKSGRNVQQELKKTFLETNGLLILGEAGLGKTREAAELALNLNREGWTILKYNGQWLDEPSSFPEKLENNRKKLLFFIDDLHRLVYRREFVPGAEDNLHLPLKIPFQERLIKVLDFFQSHCDPENIRIIVIARHEDFVDPNQPNQPSNLRKLQLDKFPKLWQNFHQYDLPEPDDEAIIQLLTDIVPRVGINCSPEDYPRIAERNDRTFGNIIENVRKVKIHNWHLAPNTFSQTLDETWYRRYQGVIKRYPVACYIYRAIELLQKVGVELDRVTVAATALMLANGNIFTNLRKRLKIALAFKDLIKNERILEPRDGQINPKEDSIEVKKYIPSLLKLLTKLTTNQPFQMLNSMFNFANTLDDLGYTQEAINVYKQILQYEPNEHESLNNLGRLHISLREYQEAMNSYERAIGIQPNKYQSWDGRGIALIKLGNYQEAIKSFDEAISIQPDDWQTFYNRGNAWYYLQKYENAIADWQRAGELNPDLARAFYNQACGYALLNDINQALENLQKAINLNSDKYQEKAIKEEDFANIRSDQQFLFLINS